VTFYRLPSFQTPVDRDFAGEPLISLLLFEAAAVTPLRHLRTEP
jgi:hypothetical protein